MTSSLPSGVTHGEIIELISSLAETHSLMLEKFALSEQNQLRVEMCLLRFILRRLEDWAENHSVIEVGHRARWLWWYWYQREYGDSRFEELSDPERRKLETTRSSFYRDHVKLWITTVDSLALSSEIAERAENDSIILHSLDAVRSSPEWSDLTDIVANIGPIARERVTSAVANAVLNSNPSRYTSSFLNVLPTLGINARIRWTQEYVGKLVVPSQVIIDVDDGGSLKKSLGGGRLSPETRLWIGKQEVDIQAEEPWSDFRTKVLAPAA